MELPMGYEYFRAKFKHLTGIDLRAYKDRQMVRRLTGYLRRAGVGDFFALAKLIEKNPGELERLKDFLTINVSEFFRNPERFEDLKERILPDLLQRETALNIWSAGCSIGAEPYSLSILLEELDPNSPHTIIGSDIDVSALAVAQKGIYRDDKLKEVSAARLRFFHRLPDHTYQIDAKIQQRVQFISHDLLSDPYPENLHLILCRNVVIYFTGEAKRRIFRRFSQALVPGGYLMVGSTESLFDAADYGFRPAGPFVYQKEGGAAK